MNNKSIYSLLSEDNDIPEIKPTPQIMNIVEYVAIKKPQLIILTPCYNSTVFVSYMESLIRTVLACKEINLPMKIHFCKNDSLVSRARNNLIAKAMHDKKTTHMLFIDADITWNPQDIFKLMMSDKPLVGGIYPIKNYNWDTVVNGKVNQILERKQHSQFKDIISDKDYVQLNMVRYNMNYESNVLNVENNLTRVRHLATGFMMIKREVIEHMSKAYSYSKYTDDVGFLEGTENDFAYALFDCGVEENHYFSEDWMFCHRWSKMGGSIYADISINLDHTGVEIYRGSFISSIL